MSDTKLFKTPSTNLTGSIPSSMYGNSGASFGTAFTSLNYGGNDQNLIFQAPSPDNTSYISRTNLLLNYISLFIEDIYINNLVIYYQKYFTKYFNIDIKYKEIFLILKKNFSKSNGNLIIHSHTIHLTNVKNINDNYK